MLANLCGSWRPFMFVPFVQVKHSKIYAITNHLFNWLRRVLTVRMSLEQNGRCNLLDCLHSKHVLWSRIHWIGVPFSESWIKAHSITSFLETTGADIMVLNEIFRRSRTPWPSILPPCRAEATAEAESPTRQSNGVAILVNPSSLRLMSRHQWVQITLETQFITPSITLHVISLRYCVATSTQLTRLI